MENSEGFTLIELLIAVVIVGILVAIGLPTYQQYVRKSHRIEATGTLTTLQMAEEKYRGNQASYANGSQIGTIPTSSYYDFTVSATGDTYTLTAAAKGTQIADTECASFSITQANEGVIYLPAACWK